jgi:tetratricopeptide (TPR) repeat protein
MRPGQGGAGERWPGFAGNGNRPGFGGGNAINRGNIGQIGDNLGVVNRPNYGGNSLVNNSFQGGNTYNNNSTYASGYNSAPVIAGNVGGGWGGSYGGGWGGGYGGGWGGGGWASPYYGNWYRGNFSNAGSFWTGFGAGALSSFGLGSLYSSGGWGYGAGALGFGGLGYATSVYNMFPTWGLSTYSDWGLGSVGSDWLNSGYTNPYYATVAAAQPASTTVVYDYSQPINVTAAPPDAAVVDSTDQVFSAARDRFRAGDYQGALDLTDQVLKQSPNAAVVHEFRGLTLFALSRYDDAAAVEYAVLSAGPGWNWSTLIGLYPDVETYTEQLRTLEAYAQANPNSSSAPFLLAYHYMTEGHDDAAAAQFERVTRLLPSDQLSASFVKALRKAPEQVAQAGPAPAQAQANAPPASQGPSQAATPTQAQAQATQDGRVAGQGDSPTSPPSPPSALDGEWKAQPAPDVSVALKLNQDGGFVWDVKAKGQKQTIEGRAGFQDGNLILQQAQGPPLVGKVTQTKPDSFVFAPPETGDKGGGLVFNR